SEANEAQAQRLLSAALNPILHGKSIYDEERFRGVNLSDEARRLLSQNLTPGRTVRLNRLLIEAGQSDHLNHRESWYDFWHLATSARAMAAYKLTFGASV